jgi:hypothetical protein
MRLVSEKPGKVCGDRIEKTFKFFLVPGYGTEITFYINTLFPKSFLQPAFQYGTVRRGKSYAAFIIDEFTILFKIYIG